jgi:hypothetical protein
LGPKILPSTLSRTPSSYVLFFSVAVEVSNPYKTTGNITVLYVVMCNSPSKWVTKYVTPWTFIDLSRDFHGACWIHVPFRLILFQLFFVLFYSECQVVLHNTPRAKPSTVFSSLHCVNCERTGLQRSKQVCAA